MDSKTRSILTLVIITLLVVILTGCSTGTSIVKEPVSVKVPVATPCVVSDPIVYTPYAFDSIKALPESYSYDQMVKAYLITIQDLTIEGDILRGYLKVCGHPK